MATADQLLTRMKTKIQALDDLNLPPVDGHHQKRVVADDSLLRAHCEAIFDFLTTDVKVDKDIVVSSTTFKTTSEGTLK